MTVYIITGINYTATEVYLNKETAEKALKEEERPRYMSGSYDYKLYLNELEVNED